MGFTSEAVAVGQRESWRALLERYLTVRESLLTVFHLIDAKTGPQPADEDLMRMTVKAIRHRATDGLPLPKYVVVLTKSDRIQVRDAKLQVEEVKAAMDKAFQVDGKKDQLADMVQPDVIVTSSRARPPIGRDQMWVYLMEAVLEQFGKESSFL